MTKMIGGQAILVASVLVLSTALRPASAIGGIVTYDGNSFPDSQGWMRDANRPFADRTIEDGWFIQQAEILPQDPPNLDVSEDDFYRRPIAEFAGTDAFFLEWRVETDGPRSGFPNVSPAVIVVGGTMGVRYHFTIAEDQVRLIDTDLSVLLIDIVPDVPHTYRLELYGLDSYSFSIDDHIVDSGVPEGAFPTLDSRIVFGGRAVYQDDLTTVRWDYVRYGVIPEPATVSILLLGSLVLFRRRANA